MYRADTANNFTATYTELVRRYGLLTKLYSQPSIEPPRKIDEPFADAPTLQDIECSICCCVPQNPVSLRSCGHVGCNGCFHQALFTVNDPSLPPGFNRCPVCRTTFSQESMQEFSQWPLFARIVWESLLVRCRRCDFKGGPKEVSKHEVEDCGKRLVKCLARDCDEAGCLNGMALHVRVCEKLYVYCIDCGHPVRFVELRKHNCIEDLSRYNTTLRELLDHRLANRCKPGPKGEICECTVANAAV